MSQPTSPQDTPASIELDSKKQESSDPNQAPLPKDASVYVSELDLSVTEADLFPIFSSYGNILSIRVVKDLVTRRSLGYAYVNFKSPKNATAALEHDFKYINNKPCRVSPFEKDPSLRNTSPKSTVFIRNLDVDVTLDQLKDAFEPFGTVIAAKIAPPITSSPTCSPKLSSSSEPKDEKDTQEKSFDKASEKSEPQQSQTFGYVQFETVEQAEAAIQELNGTPLGKLNMHLSHHVSKRSSPDRSFIKTQPSEAEANFTNVFVKNIDSPIDEEEFQNLFAKHGTIVNHSLPKDESGNFRGFGFVNFKNHSEALDAIKALNGFQFKEKPLVVTRAMEKHELDEEMRQHQESFRLKRFARFAGTNLYIKHLDFSVDDDKLQELFAPFGTITSARIMTGENGKSRGFGFVCYSSPAEAQKAISEMHNKELNGNTLYVTLANRRDTKPPHMLPQFPFFNGPAGLGDGNMSGPNSPMMNHHHHLNNNNNNSHPNGRNGRFPHYGSPLFTPYYHLAAAAAAANGVNGMAPNYGAGQPWGPPPHMGGAPNGPPGSGPGGPPPVMFAPGPPYPFPGMMPIPNNMNFRKNGPNNNNNNGNNNHNRAPNGGHGKPHGSQQQHGSSRGGRKHHENSNDRHHNHHHHHNNNHSHNANSNSPSGQRGNHYYNHHHPGPRQSNNNNYGNRHGGPNNSSATNSSVPSSSSSNTSSATTVPNTSGSSSSATTADTNPNYFPSSTLGAALASAANPAAERQVVGEALYPKVQRHPAVRNNSELTAKLTGMMLDINTQELLKWIDDDVVLNARIQEAFDQYMEFLSKRKEGEDGDEEEVEEKEEEKKEQKA